MKILLWFFPENTSMTYPIILMKIKCFWTEAIKWNRWITMLVNLPIYCELFDEIHMLGLPEHFNICKRIRAPFQISFDRVSCEQYKQTRIHLGLKCFLSGYSEICCPSSTTYTKILVIMHNILWKSNPSNQAFSKIN